MDISNVAIQPIPIPQFNATNIQLDILRLDLLHPNVSGNKWFKLKENIKVARAKGANKIITFGGAYSNHLHAAAHYCAMENIQIIGCVRGQELNEKSNPTLSSCSELGMKLLFLNRSEYTQKEQAPSIQSLMDEKTWIIPEGGDNHWGVIGAASIWETLPSESKNYSHVALSLGSGTTLKGLLSSTMDVHYEAYSSVPDAMEIIDEIKKEFSGKNLGLTQVNSLGNFGQVTPELIEFANTFYHLHHIPLDLIYTAKMMKILLDQLKMGYYPPNSKILAIHTGGLQGNQKWQNQLEF